MSRSRRHQPFCGITTCRSEKEWKQRAHRRLRMVERATTEDASEPRLEDIADIWWWGKDGKQRLDPETIARFPGLMRK